MVVQRPNKAHTIEEPNMIKNKKTHCVATQNFKGVSVTEKLAETKVWASPTSSQA